MGKEGDLWDDSLLIKAFDDAMSKYKKMHSKKRTNDSGTDGENVITNVSDSHDENNEVTREAEDNNIVSNAETEVNEARCLAPVEENPCLDSHAPELHIDPSNGLVMQDAPGDYSYSQGAEDYNNLLSQYYELEDKKQQILQKLNQFGSWNYQFSGECFSSGTQWATCSTSQEHPLPASQASHPNVVCSCCPYVCQCLVAPCSTYHASSLGGSCSGKTCTDNAAMRSGKSPTLVNGDIVKTGMGAMERAITSMKTKPSLNSNVNEESEKKKEYEGEVAQSISSGTDLTVVLNAWYSAGFYTGKYLTEQSILRNQQK